MKKTLLTLTVLLALTACDSEKARRKAALNELRSAQIPIILERNECKKTFSIKEQYSLDTKCRLIFREKMDQLDKEYSEKYGEWLVDPMMRKE